MQDDGDRFWSHSVATPGSLPQHPAQLQSPNVPAMRRTQGPGSAAAPGEEQEELLQPLIFLISRKLPVGTGGSSTAQQGAREPDASQSSSIRLKWAKVT